MKARECEIGVHVRDTRTGLRYRVTGNRVLAADTGAWVYPLDHDGDDGLIHWSHLEPLGGESHG